MSDEIESARRDIEIRTIMDRLDRIERIMNLPAISEPITPDAIVRQVRINREAQIRLDYIEASPPWLRDKMLNELKGEEE